MKLILFFVMYTKLQSQILCIYYASRTGEMAAKSLTTHRPRPLNFQTQNKLCRNGCNGTTIRIRADCKYSSEYRIVIWSTIRPRSEYEANIRYSPSFNWSIWSQSNFAVYNLKAHISQLTLHNLWFIYSTIHALYENWSHLTLCSFYVH